MVLQEDVPSVKLSESILAVKLAVDDQGIETLRETIDLQYFDSVEPMLHLAAVDYDHCIVPFIWFEVGFHLVG